MPRLKLIVGDIKDERTRENFKRIEDYFNENTLVNSTWKVFQVEIKAGANLFRVPHGLGYEPSDILVLSSIGDNNFEFDRELTNDQYVFIRAAGPVYIRFIAGRLGSLPVKAEAGPVAAPADAVQETAPKTAIPIPEKPRINSVPTGGNTPYSIAYGSGPGAWNSGSANAPQDFPWLAIITLPYPRNIEYSKVEANYDGSGTPLPIRFFPRPYHEPQKGFSWFIYASGVNAPHDIVIFTFTP